MEFDSDKAIYLQIADRIIEQVLSRQWKPEDRVPSVRDTAVQVAVNPNTVVRTYAHLQDLDIIYNQRGIGYFVGPEAYVRAVAVRKQEFLDRSLPELFKTMDLLHITIEELSELYQQHTTV